MRADKFVPTTKSRQDYAAELRIGADYFPDYSRPRWNWKILGVEFVGYKAVILASKESYGFGVFVDSLVVGHYPADKFTSEFPQAVRMYRDIIKDTRIRAYNIRL